MLALHANQVPVTVLGQPHLAASLVGQTSQLQTFICRISLQQADKQLPSRVSHLLLQIT